MKRRQFLQSTATALSMAVAPRLAAAADRQRVMTVTGEIAAQQLGPMLPHEHVLVDFIGAEKVSPERYDADEVFRIMLPFLRRVREVGGQALAECTPAYLGRDAGLLKRLSEASGVKLLSNTGYYGARQGRFLPRHAFRESADELASRWIDEWNNGLSGTDVRPGFIKIGVDAGVLTDVNQKLVRAAARCHLKTGLTIAGHTGNGQAALQQLEILKRTGVSPSSWIWVHAQNESDYEIHQLVAKLGAWVEFDGVGPTSIDRHVELVSNMRRAGLLDRVLVSHDAGWYSVGESHGGKVRGFDTLFTDFIPALKKADFRDEEITQLTVTNPANAFSIRVRTL